MSERSDERRKLFWKQIHRADQDVQEWPEYLKQALLAPSKSSPPRDPYPQREQRGAEAA